MLTPLLWSRDKAITYSSSISVGRLRCSYRKELTKGRSELRRDLRRAIVTKALGRCRIADTAGKATLSLGRDKAAKTIEPLLRANDRAITFQCLKESGAGHSPPATSPQLSRVCERPWQTPPAWFAVGFGNRGLVLQDLA